MHQRNAIPAGIWALGFVSMFMDISSEMIHAALPIYMVTALGTSTLAVGVIEGIAEATASVTKVFSGALSDWLGKRKLLAALGYGLAAATKPIFPLATSLDWLIAARFIDRVGKGIRGAPRDALVADIAPPELRSACFGLRQSLDTIGAFFGPLLAIALLWLTANDFQAVFWVAVVPALISVILIVFAVKEPASSNKPRTVRIPLSLDELGRLDSRYWWVVAIASLFTLARFSEAFLILRAESIGLPLPLVPIVLVLMSLAYSLSAYPAGIVADKSGRMTILIAGLVMLALADIVLALADNITAVAVGALLWGLHMGCTQGLLASLVAEVAPPDLRGTAFGVFNLLTGLALLLANVLAGFLWDIAGPKGTFLTGSLFAALAVLALGAVRGRLKLSIRV